MVFHSLYAQDSGVEIEQMIYTLHEDVQVEEFQRAWQRVIERHAILRTGFQWEGVDEPRQQVHPSATPQWRIEDWRQLSSAEQQQRLDRYLQEDRARGFDLRGPTLNRLALFQIGASDYQFVWTFHHAIIDGRSFVIVLKEAFDIYDAFVRGDDLQPPLPRPYSDYIYWLRDQDWTPAERFWRDLLKGFASPTPLPGNQNAQPNAHQQYTEQENYLDAELTTALKTLAKDHSVTLNNIVQGAWALLLSVYSNEADVVFGATRACRRTALEGAEWMVGPFINTLPMRIGVPANQHLIEWLAEIRQQHIEQRLYEHAPLMKIQEWSQAPRGKSLFDSILVFENYELDSYLRALGGNWANREFKLLEQTNYKLALSGWAGTQLLLKLAYDRRNFADATIAGMLGHLQTLLRNFAANPHQRLSEYLLLTPAEQQQLLVDWNDTQTDFADRCIHQLIEAQAERTPDTLALIGEGESLTYAELNARANQLARYLRGLGVGAEQLVGLAMQRSPELIIGILGILKAGGAYVPLDPAYPKERLAAMLDDARPTVLLTQQRLLEQLPHTAARVVCIDSDWSEIAAENRENLNREITPQHPAYVIYTSGSTGRPKGVMIEHRSLVNHTESACREYAITSVDRVLQFASVSFDASAEEIYPCLASGATLVLRNETMLASISTFLETCREWGITILDLPTAYWHEMVAHLAANHIALPPTLRLVIIGGERVLPERLVMWQNVVGASVQLVNTYGPTEATIVATRYDLTREVQAKNSSADESLSPNESPSSLHDAPIGRAIANTQTYILDAYLRPVPVGVAGELHIGGAGLARGYLHHPDLTAKSFIPDPFSKTPGARLYKSGDLARFLPDGEIEFCGRADDQVKLHGFRIELGDIESAMLLHTAIQDAVVLAREDEPGEKRLVAYVVPKVARTASASALTDELRAFLKHKLPAYMVPTAYVMLAALPINANGKIDRKQLPAPDSKRDEESRDYVKPKNPLQYQLVHIWEELFDLRPIGIRDNFFELGGHSLLSVRMMDRIEQALGKKLPLATLFAGATIEHLAEALLKQEAENLRSPLVAVQPQGNKIPFVYLHGDFQGGGLYCRTLARHLASDQPFYAIQPHGLEGRPIPHTLEEMAADHLKTLRDFQPAGPYQLGGHCNGGLLAFEMARQLQAAGEEVRLLVLIGATGVNARYRRLQDAVNRYCALQGFDAARRQKLFLQMQAMMIRLGEIRNYYAARFKELLQMELREQLSFIRQTGAKGWRAIGGKLSQAPSNGHRQTPDRNAQTVLPTGEDLNQAANEAYAKAMMSYVPRRYPGRVTLFWPQEWLTDNAPEPTTGWREVADEVDLHIVPGGHLTCLVNHTAALAERLQNCLNGAQGTQARA